MGTNHTIPDAIEESIRFLESSSAFEMERYEDSRRKWNCTCWHMAALYC